jgi:hypothetical protein
MHIVREHLLKDDLFKNLTEDEQIEIVDGIENYILKRLYKM